MFLVILVIVAGFLLFAGDSRQCHCLKPEKNKKIKNSGKLFSFILIIKHND
jgi:hypothetical protein